MPSGDTVSGLERRPLGPSLTAPAHAVGDGAPPPWQRSLDDLGTPLHDVTFCVVDLETTGGDPKTCGITEIGAVVVRGGECLGTFHTLVNPGRAIPPMITVLTGITEVMVHRAPRVEAVLPSFLELARDHVIVGHNVRFDLGFLNAALVRDHRPTLTNRWVDTCAIARRLVADEVPNCKLGTLADRLRLDHRPTHRALDDALATTDLLHVLLERAGRLGVTGLDDLLALPSMGHHPQAAKLRLTDPLPRAPGVYTFRDRGGRPLYVGKAANLRARVRSYFSTDTRRKVGPMLREAATIDHEVAPHGLHAAVRELRLIHELDPRYNRQGTTWRRHVWLRLTTGEAYPRLSVVRTVRDGAGLHLGPAPSQRVARRAADAVEAVLPLRRCAARPGRGHTAGPCTAAQLGVATCPCAGDVSPSDYARVVATAVTGLTSAPALLLEPLADRMVALAAAERFEEAADVRDRGAALCTLLRRQRRLDALTSSGTLIVHLPDGGGAELRAGLLGTAWGPDGAAAFDLPSPAPPGDREGALWDAEERLLVARWLIAERHQIRIDGDLPDLSDDAAFARFDTRGARSSRADAPLHSR